MKNGVVILQDDNEGRDHDGSMTNDEQRAMHRSVIVIGRKQ